MHGIEILIRLNAEFGAPELPGITLRKHPRIALLRQQVARLPIDENYRRWLFRSINLYADQFIVRPEHPAEDMWDDLEALQQVTLGDMNELNMQRLFRRFAAERDDTRW